MTVNRNKQIGSMFFVVFVVLVTFSIPNVSATTTEEQRIYNVEAECKQQILSKDSLTFAEKAVKVKACGNEARLALQTSIIATPPSAVQILQHQVRDCEAKYPIYSMIGQIGFLSLERSTLARHCVIMYELDEWQIQDDSRMNVLVEGLGNALQMELDKDIQLRIDNVHKALERYHRG
jgi:hypothetical protein